MKHNKKVTTHGVRRLPVSGTGGRGVFAGYFRNPKTTQEKRFAFEEPDFFPVRKQFFRAGRGSNALPCAWLDIWRSDVKARNWKKYRKTQWKPKK